MLDEPLLEGEDIQGNILPGFGRTEERLVGFQGAEAATLARALGVIAEHLTALPAVMAYRDLVKARLSEGQGRPHIPDLWLNYALGVRATNALGLGAARDGDPSFGRGMIAGAGDSPNPTLADGRPNLGAPANWRVGAPDAPLDLLLIFAADDDIVAKSDVIAEQIRSAGLVLTYSETGVRLSGDREHFGFRDGISQPGVLGVIRDGDGERPLTTRYGVPPNERGVKFGRPGQPLGSPTNFILSDTAAPLRNGSYLVFRRLIQDVAAFYQDTARVAEQASNALGAAVEPDEIRACAVGRQPSGQPLMRRALSPDGEPEPEMALNHFNFATSVPDLVLGDGAVVPGCPGDRDYQDGGACPIWAHIRKVNPRDLFTNLGGPDQTRNSQVLRRGISFGSAFDHDDPTNPANIEQRGLLFMCYQASITYQFEVLNSVWMNSYFGPATGGFDLLAGQRLDQDGRHAPRTAGYFDIATDRKVDIEAPQQWVVANGGAYLFAPSVSWTRTFADASG